MQFDYSSQLWARREPGTCNSIHVTQVGVTASTPYAILQCLPGHIRRELGPKRRNQDWYQHSQVALGSIAPLYLPLKIVL